MKTGKPLFQTLLLLILPFIPAKFNSSPLSQAKGIKVLQQDLCLEELQCVVIDPGHGGHDPGCLGGHSKEKHIALAISKLMAESLRAQYPNLKVILTRETDVFIPLHERARIANRNNADLFISVHCNYFPPSRRVNGSETYVLGTHRMEDNMEVAMRENASILLEEDYETNYDYDPNSPEGHIMLAMFQNAYLDRSIRFAEIIEVRMNQDTHRKSRGVRQAGFLVLRETAMPSVLVETGYLSNSEEEDYLDSPEGQAQVATAMTRAFSAYRAEILGIEIADFEPLEPILPKPLPVPEPAEVIPPPVVVIAPVQSETDVSTERVIVEAEDQVQFRIQLAASPRPLDVQASNWTNIPYQVQIVEESGYYKYQARSFTSLPQAEAARSLLQDSGFVDAFIVAYQGNKKITIQQANQLLSREIRP